MRLDLLLVEKGLCSSRQEAQEIISKGDVLVNGSQVAKQSKDIKEAATIEVLSTRRYVSRGGEKLAGAFSFVFSNDEATCLYLKDKVGLDIGSSTGGFTDFLLQHGIRHVTAVDVGTNQLHERIRVDARVTSIENTDIRDFHSNAKYDVVVADLSFIPLKAVLGLILSFGTAGSRFFLLIKPQFEVGKGNTKKGLVKDTSLVDGVLNEYETCLKDSGIKDLLVRPCVLTGGDGNQEYFAIFTL